MEWGNLLPSLNVCNIKKRDFDPEERPIVNPLKDNPKEYFYILNGRLYPLEYGNKKAVNTLEVCDLNNERHFKKSRRPAGRMSVDKENDWRRKWLTVTCVGNDVNHVCQWKMN